MRSVLETLLAVTIVDWGFRPEMLQKCMRPRTVPIAKIIKLQIPVVQLKSPGLSPSSPRWPQEQLMCPLK